jgi:hypothetical protein
VAEAALTLYQAGWCPFSSAVREVPFIVHYMDRQPEYEQLVASGYRDR